MLIGGKSVKRIKRWIKKNKVDILVGSALIIIIATTMSLNIYIGLYLLALILIGIAVIISRFK